MLEDRSATEDNSTKLESGSVLGQSTSHSSTPLSKKTKKKVKLNTKLQAMEQLDTLIHRRGVARGKVTRLLNSIRPDDEQIVQLSEAQVKVYRKKLESAHKEYCDIHEKILSLVSPEEREAHDEHFENFDELHDELAIHLEEQLEKFSRVVTNTSQLNSSVVQQPVIVHQPLRMPVPSFDGQYENWPKFKAMFRDLVDKGPDPPAVKLYHLDKALVGGAAGLIDAKTINEGNYRHAWEILEERYENKRHTIDGHIHGLLNMNKMSRESYAELRRLLDECTKHVEGLKFLDQEFSGVSELIVVHLLSTSLDKDTRRRWESTIKHGELPTYNDTLKFLKEQCFVLERCTSTTQKSIQLQIKHPFVPSKQPMQKIHAAVTSSDQEFKCDFCTKQHQNFTCPEFKSLSVQQRLSKVREKNVCFNCLRRGHRSTTCSSNRLCQKCKRRHHTLLHAEEKPKLNEGEPMPNRESTPTSEDRIPEYNTTSGIQMTSATCSSQLSPIQQVLLLTAIVDVLDENYNPHPCRILLDSASQANLISRSMANKLGAKQIPSNIIVAGVNGTKTHSSSSCVVQVCSRYTNFCTSIQCLITDRVTADLPTTNLDISTWKLPVDVQLADSTFHERGRIDMLVGAQLFLKLLLPGEHFIDNSLPVLKETQFGWVVGGTFNNECQDSTVHSHSVTIEELNQSIQQFWSVEDVAGMTQSTTEEEESELHFQTTHRRNASGRYVVQLPLRKNIDELGDSRVLALRRFYALERKLMQQPELRRQYVDFMTEYEELGHCKEVNENNDTPNVTKWYLPHHAVLRPSNTTTKCRVVFDASAKLSGCSLNDVMMVGAICQSDLLAIVLRFREPRYVLTADVAKMYRQIIVDKCHTPLQRVFWRKQPSDPIRVLELTTVTYGTASAPFLATRALLQLAIDEKLKFPLAAEIIEKSFYVDNALFGFDDFKQTSEAQLQLVCLMRAGGLHLHKGASNEPKLMHAIPMEDREELVQIDNFGINEVIKTLGLLWNPSKDELVYMSLPKCDIQNPTKRQVLSIIARMFDPLGLVAPVILIGKLLMQQIWKDGLDWDEVISSDMMKNWNYFLDAIGSVNHICIPRQVVAEGAPIIEMHGFADASQNAYGACVYIRSVIPNRNIVVRLISAKSKLVPKNVLTIPRKELLAALLLHRLVRKIIHNMSMPIKKTVLWSDSQIVLAWLKKNPNQLEVFVKNRVCEIISTGNQFTWNYVQTKQNPADLVSRGQPANMLADNDLWWNGPLFLRDETYQMVDPEPPANDDIPEMKRIVSTNVMVQYEELPIFKKFESFRKTQRVLAFVLRFSRNTRVKLEGKRIYTSYPTVIEMRESMKTIVWIIQNQAFHDEIVRIQSGEQCKILKNLVPFLDEGLLRVGGRLRHSQLPYESKHQYILPNRHPLVENLIIAVHRENLHIGPSGLLAMIRRQFWIIRARSTIRKITYNCIQCFRRNPTIIDQQMGDLPSSRCERAPAFQKVGVDFAGPILLKSGRKTAPMKGYFCVFVCLVTKGIHLEAVESLSTDAFIASLRRFVSRRGLPETIYSDNGTNFIGARNELHELYLLFKKQLTFEIYKFCEPRQITWKTIPPSAPHMGGIWEAGVKNVKAIMKKIFKSATLTVVEFATLLCQIEAILNSRPLYTSSGDPTEPESLTPGHFMIDRPLTSIPEPTFDEIPMNRLSRWQYIQSLRDSFWKRWTREYLMELQTRSKWTTKRTNIIPGVVVLIKDDNLPPHVWKLGKIVKTYPGADNMVRVVDVRTRAGIFRRPIHKLAPLPILDNSSVSSKQLWILPGGGCSSNN